METNEPSKLEIGKKYQVVFEDCCVQGAFTATLLEKQPKIEGDEYPNLLFDNGVTISGWVVKYVWVEGASQ